MIINKYRYTLEKYNGMSSRYVCPKCGDKSFVLYIDTETGEHISPKVGRCNHESKCGYHYTPKQYFKDNNILFDTHKPKFDTPKTKTVSFIPFKLLEGSLKNYEKNHFIKFLIDLFGNEITSQLISKYYIGTSKHWDGATVFWQIDTRGKVRTGKIMLYNPATGHRIKKPFNYIAWEHTALKQPDFELKQCLFGEHLLQDKTKSVAIVESEKTAIIASVYLPQFIWLATGGKSNLNADKFNILRGRTVAIFPDLNGYNDWTNKIKGFKTNGAKFIFSDLLESLAPEEDKAKGYDLADYLIKQDWQLFRKKRSQEQPTTTTQPEPLPKYDAFQPKQIEQPEQIQTKNWDEDIKEIETFFTNEKITTKTLKLNSWTTIIDIPLFIENSLAVVKANNGNITFKQDLERLLKLKEILQN